MSEQEYIDTPEDKEFLKGFNNGWIIAEHEPKISKIVVGALQRTEEHGDIYLEGIQEGILRYELEKAKERFRSFPTPTKGKTPDKDKGRTKDI